MQTVISQSRTVVYTAVFGDYDYIASPRAKPDGWDFVCFTDGGTRVPRPWRRVVVPMDEASPTYLNRRLKILGHPALEEYRRTLYVDGNIAIRREGGIPLAPLVSCCWRAKSFASDSRCRLSVGLG